MTGAGAFEPRIDRAGEAFIDLYWLPLGAGGTSVRLNGRVYETFAAALERRPARQLYHSALAVRVDGDCHAIEMAPVWSGSAAGRGVVCEGAVGARALGRSRWFRYEVRCWRGGDIPDVGEAVASPQTLSLDPLVARQLLATVPSVPALVWGRDELHLGDMWNSNSLVAWLLAQQELDQLAELPTGGRAPGWDAGLRLARTHQDVGWPGHASGHRAVLGRLRRPAHRSPATGPEAAARQG